MKTANNIQKVVKTSGRIAGITQDLKMKSEIKKREKKKNEKGRKKDWKKI